MRFEDLPEEEQQALLAKEARQAKQLDVDFAAIMATAGGRRHFWQQIGSCHVFSPVFDPDHSVMCLREGRRQVGLEILQRINVLCPDMYQVMVNENTTYEPEAK